MLAKHLSALDSGLLGVRERALPKEGNTVFRCRGQKKKKNLFVTQKCFQRGSNNSSPCTLILVFLSTSAYNSITRNPTIYNIIRWFAGTNDLSTKSLMFQALFFFIFL